MCQRKQLFNFIVNLYLSLSSKNMYHCIYKNGK